MARGVRRVGPHFDDLGSIPLSIVRPEDIELCVQDILCEIALREKAENVLRLPLRLVIWEQQQHAVSLTVCLLTTIHVKHLDFSRDVRLAYGASPLRLHEQQTQWYLQITGHSPP